MQILAQESRFAEASVINFAGTDHAMIISGETPRHATPRDAINCLTYRQTSIHTGFTKLTYSVGMTWIEHSV